MNRAACCQEANHLKLAEYFRQPSKAGFCTLACTAGICSICVERCSEWKEEIIHFLVSKLPPPPAQVGANLPWNQQLWLCGSEQSKCLQMVLFKRHLSIIIKQITWFHVLPASIPQTAKCKALPGKEFQLHLFSLQFEIDQVPFINFPLAHKANECGLRYTLLRIRSEEQYISRWIKERLWHWMPERTLGSLRSGHKLLTSLRNTMRAYILLNILLNCFFT